VLELDHPEQREGLLVDGKNIDPAGYGEGCGALCRKD
jgi:hypothetical protein